VYDLGGRPPVRLTFRDQSGGASNSPLWTPDGQSIVFEPAETAAGGGLVMLPADGSTSTPVPVTPPGHFHPHGFTADGRELLAVYKGTTSWDIVRLVPPGAASTPTPVVATPKNEGFLGAALSPNKHFLAYVSDLTGRNEIWVRPYPGPGAPERISPNGGTEPTWAQGGRGLIYLEGDRFMHVTTTTDGAFSFGVPTFLFETPVLRVVQPPSYDVAPDGRLLVIKAPPRRTNTVRVVIDWPSAADSLRE
jgi:Tol biopolymer transport system component